MTISLAERNVKKISSRNSNSILSIEMLKRKRWPVHQHWVKILQLVKPPIPFAYGGAIFRGGTRLPFPFFQMVFFLNLPEAFLDSQNMFCIWFLMYLAKIHSIKILKAFSPAPGTRLFKYRSILKARIMFFAMMVFSLFWVFPLFTIFLF